MKSKGFTLIELLVTLVLIGLISSVVSPAVFKWMGSRDADAKRTLLQNEISALPLRALNTSTAQVITSANDLGLASETDIEIIEPIQVTKNGYCVGGMILITISSTTYEYSIDSPFCKISIRK